LRSAGHANKTAKVELGIFRTYPLSMNAAILLLR
jgi:hypothetical protein